MYMCIIYKNKNNKQYKKKILYTSQVENPERSSLQGLLEAVGQDKGQEHDLTPWRDI